MAKIVVDGIEYAPVKDSGEIKIVILQRGHVAVGRFNRDGSDCVLKDASIIRVWGTTKGLGELRSGPTPKTVLDKCGKMGFDYLTVISTLDDLEQSKWENVL
jgi:hypothetical protein